jgi:hypothetical protein
MSHAVPLDASRGRIHASSPQTAAPPHAGPYHLDLLASGGGNMNILDAVTGARNGAAVDQLAKQFGLEPAQANAAVAALMPALANGLQREMSRPSGLAGLLGALSGGKHEAYLENPSKLGEPATTADGNGILGHVLGSKDASRAAAAQAGQKTGIDPAILRQMLPLVAALVMGGLSKQAKTSGGDPKQAAGGLSSMLGPLLDRDGDGSMMDDVAGMVGGFMKSRK